MRITRGAYSGDLAMLTSVRKNRVQALLVPRVNLLDIEMKMKKVDEDFSD